MEIEIVDFIVKVAACVCGKDGIISQAEEKAMLNLIILEYPNYPLERFNQALDEFFDETLQIEDYLHKLARSGLNPFIINICELSASADGLDIKENIALHKVKLILGSEI
ncbi:MAG: hypothetical protein HRT55_17890 [Colwellia sp.]|uniref:hypothetical protein n=1 Tax=Colwellia sp. TaxID=56799 RepID=UPI0025C6D5AA|nr:hypothetical protein [Colwellia sp.]NQZ28177.1 hypothetical protein [Colwellia sp.]